MIITIIGDHSDKNPLPILADNTLKVISVEEIDLSFENDGVLFKFKSKAKKGVHNINLKKLIAPLFKDFATYPYFDFANKLVSFVSIVINNNTESKTFNVYYTFGSLRHNSNQLIDFPLIKLFPNYPYKYPHNYGTFLPLTIFEGYPFLLNRASGKFSFVEYSDGVKTSGSPKVISNCGGVYLSWLNRAGGFSFWLFENYNESSLTQKNKLVINNDFGDVRIVGKEFNEVLTASSIIKDGAEFIKGLLISKAVFLYTAKKGSKVNWVTDFQKVVIDGGTSKMESSKSNHVKYTITILKKKTVN